MGAHIIGPGAGEMINEVGFIVSFFGINYVIRLLSPWNMEPLVKILPEYVTHILPAAKLLEKLTWQHGRARLSIICNLIVLFTEEK